MSVGWMEVVYPLIRLLSHFLLLSCGRFLVHILALSYWVPLASLLSSSTAEVQFSEWTRAQKPWWKISSFGLQLGRLWRASLAFWLPCVHAHVHAKSPHSCPTLYDTMACSPPDSSVHEILQARILGGGVAISSSKGSSQPRDRTWVSYVSYIRRWALYHESHLKSPTGWKKKISFGIKAEAYLLPNSIIKWATLSLVKHGTLISLFHSTDTHQTPSMCHIFYWGLDW